MTNWEDRRLGRSGRPASVADDPFLTTQGIACPPNLASCCLGITSSEAACISGWSKNPVPKRYGGRELGRSYTPFFFFFFSFSHLCSFDPSPYQDHQFLSSSQV